MALLVPDIPDNFEPSVSLGLERESLFYSVSLQDIIHGLHVF